MFITLFKEALSPLISRLTVCTASRQILHQATTTLDMRLDTSRSARHLKVMKCCPAPICTLQPANSFLLSLTTSKSPETLSLLTPALCLRTPNARRRMKPRGYPKRYILLPHILTHMTQLNELQCKSLQPRLRQTKLHFGAVPPPRLPPERRRIILKYLLTFPGSISTELLHKRYPWAFNILQVCWEFRIEGAKLLVLNQLNLKLFLSPRVADRRRTQVLEFERQGTSNPFYLLLPWISTQPNVIKGLDTNLELFNLKGVDNRAEPNKPSKLF